MKITEPNLYLCMYCVNVALLGDPSSLSLHYSEAEADGLLARIDASLQALPGVLYQGLDSLAQEFGTCPCALCGTRLAGLRIHCVAGIN